MSRLSATGEVYSIGDASVSRDLSRLAARSASWAASSASERVEVAEAMLECVRDEDWGGEWLREQVALEGVDAKRASAFASQTRFIFGSCVSDLLQAFIDANCGAEMSERRRLLLEGKAVPVGAAVPGATFELKRGTPAAVEGAKDGTVAVVLGAGNQSFLSLIDALHRALLEGECVMIKHHPLRPWLAEPFAAILGPLMALDVVAQCVDAGVTEAEALVTDDRVGHVHVTGSVATRDAVRRRLDAAGKADVDITAELGCATPWLVTPGEWTPAELKNGARALVAAKKANGGSNCLSPQTVLVGETWPQRDAFLDLVRAELGAQTTSTAYYPGARQRRDDVLETYGLDRLGDDVDDVALLELGPSRSETFDDAALTQEVFGPLLAVVDLPEGLRAAGTWLLDTAVPFANSKSCLGSLSCTLLTPASLDDAFVDAAIDTLNYGSVAHNCWSVFGYTAMCNGATWGAHPTDVDGHSGKGAVGNAYRVPDVVKTAVRGGSLQKPAVDLAKPPPAVVFDALHASLLKEQGSGPMMRAAVTLLLRRGLGKLRALVPFGPRGPKFGAAL